jgi:putative tricarboxylic transport membrane protein
MTEKSIENPSPLSIPEKRVDQVSSILWISFGIFVIIQSQKLDYTDDFGPSAGFFPFWLGVISIFLGAMLTIQASFRKTQKQEITIASKSAAFKMFMITLGLFVFILLIERAGFFLSAGLLFLFLLYAVERQSLKYSLIAAVLSFFLLWLIFGVGLKLQLPVGFMKFMRFI